MNCGLCVGLYAESGATLLVLRTRRSLRNCENGMEFLTCDECEDEYNK